MRGVIVQRLANALRDLGLRVEFVELGVGNPLRYVLARRRVAEAVRAIRPDLIHVHFGWSGLAVPRTAVPIVTTFNGDDLTGTPTGSGRISFKSRLGILVSQRAAWRSSRCIAVSASLRERLWTRALRAKTEVIRDAVDPALFRPLPRAEARARLGISPDAVEIIFPHTAGEPRKRLWLAEAAVAALREWIPQAHLWVVNGRPADEMPWYYAAADAMIVTSMFEGGPSASKEALACGTPVVSVAVGDTQLFKESPEGIVCADAQPSALSLALREVLRRPAGVRTSYLPPPLSLPEAARAIVHLYRDAVTRSGGGVT
jgi:glycosyltransferase involved in cell wall biosynthesis